MSAYCSRCNNTHWNSAPFKKLDDCLGILLLMRPYRCLKCGHVRLLSIFRGFSGFRLLKHSDDRSRLLVVRCLSCGGSVHRSKRHGLERILVTQAYRSDDCQARFRFLGGRKSKLVLFSVQSSEMYVNRQVSVDVPCSLKQER